MTAILLDAALATGAGAGERFIKIPKDHTVVATMGGSVVATAVTVALEGSIDNATWVVLASHEFTAAEISAEQAMFHIIGKPVRWVRANLTVLTGGTLPTITVKYEPRQGR